LKTRAIERVFRGSETFDGAGVRLLRVFGHRETSLMDPFLLLDAFGSKDPSEYLPGFPWHPHRGIETVTYLLEGSVEHSDSLGNSGVIGPGDIQWMTAGSGIVHQEMPQASPTGVRGFQLWVNLARAEKMRDGAYRGAIAAQIPETTHDEARVKVIAGELGGVHGPLAGISRSPSYFDVWMPPTGKSSFEAPQGRTCFAFIYEGSMAAPDGSKGSGAADTKEGDCVLFGDGERVELRAGPKGARFLLVQGDPLREPIAWRGPIVMNTEAELDIAFKEYATGKFVKTR